MIKNIRKLRGGGNSGGTPANTQVSKAPWVPAQPYIKSGLQNAASLYAQGPEKYTPWSQVANLTDNQISAQNGIRNYVNSDGTQQYMNTAQQGVQDSLSGAPNDTQQLANSGMNKTVGLLTNNNTMDANPVLNQLAYGENQNPYLQQEVGNQLQKISNNFSMNTLPGMRRQAIGDGSYGSSRNEMAEGQAAGQMGNQMYDTANQMYGNTYNTQQTQSLNALNSLGQNQLNQANTGINLFNQGNQQQLNDMNIGLSNYAQTLNMPISMLQQLGQNGLQQYQQDQNVLNDATNRWNFNQNAPWQNLGQYKAMVDGTSQYGGSGVSNSYTPIQPTNMAGNVAGGLLSGAAMYGAMNPNGRSASMTYSANQPASSWPTR